MDNEARRHPIPAHVAAELEARNLRLVEVAKVTDDDILDKIERLVGVVDKEQWSSIEYGADIDEVRDWIKQVRSLDRKGMR